MRLSTVIIAATSLAGLCVVNASDQEAELFSVGIACTGFDLTGTCGDIMVSAIRSPCMTFAAPLYQSISSLVMDPGLGCTFYVSQNCGGALGWVSTNPNEVANFYGTSYDQDITSYICFTLTS